MLAIGRAEYGPFPDHGKEEADRALEELRPRVTEHLPGVSAMRAAANLKASHPMALADCFAVALAASERSAPDR